MLSRFSALGAEKNLHPVEIAEELPASAFPLQQNGVTVKNQTLRLSVIVCHSGTTIHFGHYYVLAKSNADDSSWICVNDHVITEVADLCDSPASQDAYLLLYTLERHVNSSKRMRVAAVVILC
jgi:ubiquitin C-terminal hydrolase